MNLSSPAVALTLALALSLPLAAHADTADLPEAAAQRYWSVQGGVNRLTEWPATVNFGGPTVDAALGLEKGAQFGVALGHRKGKARYELEYQHGRFDVNRVTIGAASSAADATGHYDVLTVNALRQLPVNEQLALYAGLGIGVGKLALPQVTVASGCRCIAAAENTGFAWQARVGAEHRIGAEGHGFVQASWLSLHGASSGGASFVTYPRRGFAVLGVGFRRSF